MAAIVKVGDTLPDISEGLNAGMWAVGLSLTGNELGLDEVAFKRLTPEELGTRRAEISDRMYQAGAHYVVYSIWDLPPVLDEINLRLAHGERPYPFVRFVGPSCSGMKISSVNSVSPW